MKLCCCCESSCMWMGKGMRCDVQVLVLGKSLSSDSTRFVSHVCLDTSGPARSPQCLNYTAGTAFPAAMSTQGGRSCSLGPDTGGLECFLVQSCRHLLLPSQQTSPLEIRSGPLSKNVKKFSTGPSAVPVCVLSCLS